MSSGGATLVQEPLPAGICDLRCVSVAGQWTARLCAGAQPDLKVVSPDCEWLAVLQREPEVGDGIESTVLGALFRRGKPIRTVAAAELPAASVTIAFNRLQWLGGGAAQFREGGLALPLRSGPDIWLPLESPMKRKAKAPPAQLSYVDEQGSLHLVDNRDEIPPRYRARAAEVTSSSVTVVPMPAPPPVEPEAAPPPRRPPPSPPARHARPSTAQGPAPYGLTYQEWLQVLSGQRGLGDPNRPACIGNDGKPKACNE